MTTSTPQNLAAWLDKPDTPLRVGPAEMPVPTPDEVLIKVHAVAMNPVDVGRQYQGIINPSYPWVFGDDVAGVIESVGSDVTKFKAGKSTRQSIYSAPSHDSLPYRKERDQQLTNSSTGDRVLAMSTEFLTQKTANSAFQAYMTTTQTMACKIPNTMSFTDACTIPLGLTTAAGMAFETATLQLRYPQPSTSTSPSQEVITLWGASSSVGANALQMLKAANYHVIALASTRNHDLLTSLGADTCFDYSDPELISKVSSFVKSKGWTSAGILAAAGFLPPGPVAEETRQKTGELALALGGKMFVSTPLARGMMEVPEMPEGVEASNGESFFLLPLSLPSSAHARQSPSN